MNNLVVGHSGDTPVYCDSTYSSLVPQWSNNNVYLLNGTPYGGKCLGLNTANENISADPQFVNVALGDYHLLPSSPSIDAGSNSAPGLPMTDADGQPRIQDGNGDSQAVIDHGIYERAPAIPESLTVYSERDAFIRNQPENRNEGANPRLYVHHKKSKRTVVGFALSDVPQEPGLLRRAQLITTLAKPTTGTVHDVEVAVHSLSTSFTEGNGKKLGLDKPSRQNGVGPGVTWNCSTDAQIANNIQDCPTRWQGAETTIGPALDTVIHTKGQTGDVVWDITETVRQALAAGDTDIDLLIKLAHDQDQRKAIYWSKEGAELNGDPEKWPRLVIEFSIQDS